MSTLRTAAALLLLASAPLALAQIDPDTLAGLKARNIGPAGMSGRVTAIEGVPSRPGLVYAGAATGGVWKSTNGGLTFAPVFDDQPVHAIGAIAVSPANPDVVWVGTGEGNTRNSVSIGNGVYRSNDGGRNWTHLGLEKSERIYRIAAHPRDERVAYVCATGPEWGEGPERGVFKTEDGGKSWKKLLFVDEKTGCGELQMDPRNPDKLIAAMWQFRRWPYFFKSGGPGSGLYLSHDGGASWRKLQQEDGLPKGELGRIGVAFSPSNPEIVYAMAEAEKSAVLRSDDGGRSWRAVNTDVNSVPRPFYFADLRVDPQWPNRVYSLDYEVRVSEDGGKSFKTLPGASWSQIHGDHHAMWIDPAEPRHIYVGDDGGVAESHDRGQSFRFVANLPLAQYYHVAVDMARPYNVYGGLQDNGSWRGPSSVWQNGGIRNHAFTEAGGGDGFETLPHPREPGVGYSLWQGGNLMRFDLATGEQRLVKPTEPAGTRLRFNWNAGLAIDPFEPDSVYLGSQFLHRSRDRGESWQTISADLTSNNPEWQKQDETGGLTPDVSSAENYETIVAIAPSPKQRGLVWVGSDDGRLHLTRDGGTSWTSLEKGLKGVPEHTWIPHVEPSPHDAGTAFVVLDNHRRGDFAAYAYRTDDFGASFRALGTKDVRGYALVLRQDPVKKDLLYLGTEFGLYVSFDGGQRFTHLKKALPTASVMDLVVHPREHDLVIGTHGRALWVLDDVRPLRALSDAVLAEPLHLFEIPDAQQYWSRAHDGGFGFGAGEFRGENRPYGAILTFSLNQPGLPLQDPEKERARKEKLRKEAAPAQKPADKAADESADEEPKVEIKVTDSAGKEVRTFKAPARLGVNRAVWDLRRNAGKQPPKPTEPQPFSSEPTGSEVAPGSYTVSVSYGERQAKHTVNVQADPRSRNSAEDWRRRDEAIRRVEALQDAAVDAIWRIRRTSEDVAAVSAKVRAARQDAGEKDDKKLDADPLVKAGADLKQGLAALDKKLWQAPETTKGIAPENDAMTALSYASGYAGSSLDPPSPTQLEHVARAEAKLDGVLKELNAFFEKEVAAYRKQVQDANVGLLPALPPLTLPAR
ncbi:MAG: hypothetical protein AB7O37_07405 [Vicinamibacteria bacterium]